MRPRPPALSFAVLLAVACSDPNAARDAREVGWTVRHDEWERKTDTPRFLVDAEGLEVKPGMNVTIWHPDLEATGSYRMSAVVVIRDAGLHPHGAGIVFGGSDVHGEQQRYTYFLVRGDRQFLVKTRTGEESPELVPWTEHAAIAAEDAEYVSRNRLAVEVGAEAVRFLVNGTEVHRRPRGDLPVEGRCGFRLVHDLHVRFDGLTVEPLAR